MPRRLLALICTTLIAPLGALAGSAQDAHAAGGLACTETSPAQAPAPSPGNPCWTQVDPYPFGEDGEPNPPEADCESQYGPTWQGDNAASGPCNQEVVTSMAFRAWNRGLAATTPVGQVGSSNAFGVWLFNGSTWFPDPSFPGSGSCPGNTILWAGKLDYWLIGGSSSSSAALQTLCRFDGVNLEWDVLSLPAATLARLPVDPFTLNPIGGVTAGACFAWNNCWFFGTDGIEVHWDGQTLTDATGALGPSPWLEANATAAVAGSDTSGNAFGLAVTASGTSTSTTFLLQSAPTPDAPDGSATPQVWSSQGGPFAPLSVPLPTTAEQDDPNTTDLVAIGADAGGDVWVAGEPTNRDVISSAPAPLLRLSESGQLVPCAGYGASTFSESADKTNGVTNGFAWNSVSVLPGGSALAGGYDDAPGLDPEYSGSFDAPVVVRAACGQSPAITQFERPDPFAANQANAAPTPVDLNVNSPAVIVSASAVNDAWAAVNIGNFYGSQTERQERAHLYLLTDGQAPDAPRGNDDEAPRPSLFPLQPPTYVIEPPQTIVIQGTSTTTKKKGKATTVKEAPAVYDTTKKLNPHTLTLTISFRVRRPVTLGIEAFDGRKLVAWSGYRRFTAHTGKLTLVLNRAHWPTRLSFKLPRA
ncbi:MAG: hypothetical protein ACLP0J_06395 [Solirubrobacteraceae bacterium]